MSLIGVLHGGPGTGKSTTAALVFGSLKRDGYNVEVAHEYAKDLTWEERTNALACQEYIWGKQVWRERRLQGQVDAIITDTSTLLSLVYGQPAKAFREAVLEEYRAKHTVNIFLRRDPDRPYNVRGRNQTATDATRMDKRIEGVLVSNEIPYTALQLDNANQGHVFEIVEMMKEAISAAKR